MTLYDQPKMAELKPGEQREGYNSPGVEALWGMLKSPNNVTTTFFNTV